MMDFVPFGKRLSPDTIAKLERAAEQRFETAEILRKQGRRLAALYMYGYSAEIGLSAAYFRSIRFSRHAVIDRETRQRRMALARLIRTAQGEPLMNSDPHPIVGWARFLEWQRLLSGGLTQKEKERLREAINKAETIYSQWRPELRYKTTEITDRQLEAVHPAVKWLVDNQRQL